MTVTMAQLQALCDPPIANLHGYARFDVRPSIANGGIWVLTSRPQYAVRPRRLAMRSAADWNVHDIRIGNTSQLPAGPVLGAVFSPERTGMDAALDMPVVQAAQDVTLHVEYIGDNPAGAPFIGTMICDGVGRGVDGGRVALPITSGTPIHPCTESGARVLIQIGTRVLRFEERRRELDAIVEVDSTISDLVAEYTTTRDDLKYQLFGSPIVVSLGCAYIQQIPYQVIYGVDEFTGLVLFEIGGGMPSNRRPFFATFKADGYTPDWWASLRQKNPFIPEAIEHMCKVCCATPNAEGERVHGRGCYVLSADGGGSDWPTE